MSVHKAMREVLVDNGPLADLHEHRLPPKQVSEVDAVFFAISGIGAERYLGKTDVRPEAAVRGVTHDGGVQWWHTGGTFHFRASDTDKLAPAMAAAMAVRDVLAQFAGESFDAGGERIFRCEVGTSPYFVGEDDNGRPVAMLSAEIWHKPMQAFQHILIGADRLTVDRAPLYTPGVWSDLYA